MIGSHCAHFRDDAQHPSGPRWSCDKACANLIIFYKAKCHFEFQAIFGYFGHIYEGQTVLEGAEVVPNSSALYQCPKLIYRVSIIHFSTILQGTTFFSKHGLPFLVWAPLPVHKGAMPPCTHWCLDLTPREKWKLVNSITIMGRELIIAWKLKDLPDTGQ